jgi:hypothetical protein
LKEEARHTAQNHSFWAQDTKLRYNGIDFVSAGTIDPLKPQDQDIDAEDLLSSQGTQLNHITPKVDSESENGDRTLHISEEAVVDYYQRFSVPAPSSCSDSSEELILFKGRRKETERRKNPFSFTNMHQQIAATEGSPEPIITETGINSPIKINPERKPIAPTGEGRIQINIDRPPSHQVEVVSNNIDNDSDCDDRNSELNEYSQVSEVGTMEEGARECQQSDYEDEPVVRGNERNYDNIRYHKIR